MNYCFCIDTIISSNHKPKYIPCSFGNCQNTMHYDCLIKNMIKLEAVICLSCILRINDPLYPVFNIIKEFCLDSNSKNIEFSLNESDYNVIDEKQHENSALRLEVKCIKVQEYTKLHEQKWPDQGSIRLNDKIVYKFEAKKNNKISLNKRRKDVKYIVSKMDLKKGRNEFIFTIEENEEMKKFEDFYMINDAESDFSPADLPITFALQDNKLTINSYDQENGLISEDSYKWPLSRAFKHRKLNDNSSFISNIHPLHTCIALKSRVNETISSITKDISSYSNFFDTDDQISKNENTEKCIFFIGIYLTTKLSIQRLHTNIIQKQHLTKEKSLEFIRGQFAERTHKQRIIISLLCNFNQKLCKIPARGAHCKHVTCFDMDNFITECQKNPKLYWNCPICKMPSFNMIIDDYILEIIQVIKTKSITTEKVIFYKNGCYELKRKTDSNSDNNCISKDNYQNEPNNFQVENIPIDAEETMITCTKDINHLNSICINKPTKKSADKINVIVLSSDDDNGHNSDQRDLCNQFFDNSIKHELESKSDINDDLPIQEKKMVLASHYNPKFENIFEDSGLSKCVDLIQNMLDKYGHTFTEAEEQVLLVNPIDDIPSTLNFNDVKILFHLNRINNKSKDQIDDQFPIEYSIYECIKNFGSTYAVLKKKYGLLEITSIYSSFYSSLPHTISKLTLQILRIISTFFLQRNKLLIPEDFWIYAINQKPILTSIEQKVLKFIHNYNTYHDSKFINPFKNKVNYFGIYTEPLEVVGHQFKICDNVGSHRLNWAKDYELGRRVKLWRILWDSKSRWLKVQVSEKLSGLKDKDPYSGYLIEDLRYLMSRIMYLKMCWIEDMRQYGDIPCNIPFANITSYKYQYKPFEFFLAPEKLTFEDFSMIPLEVFGIEISKHGNLKNSKNKMISIMNENQLRYVEKFILKSLKRSHDPVTYEKLKIKMKDMNITEEGHLEEQIDIECISCSDQILLMKQSICRICPQNNSINIDNLYDSMLLVF